MWPHEEVVGLKTRIITGIKIFIVFGQDEALDDEHDTADAACCYQVAGEEVEPVKEETILLPEVVSHGVDVLGTRPLEDGRPVVPLGIMQLLELSVGMRSEAVRCGARQNQSVRVDEGVDPPSNHADEVDLPPVQVRDLLRLLGERHVIHDDLGAVDELAVLEGVSRKLLVVLGVSILPQPHAKALLLRDDDPGGLPLERNPHNHVQAVGRLVRCESEAAAVTLKDIHDLRPHGVEELRLRLQGLQVLRRRRRGGVEKDALPRI
mmetsp:Transcript_27355/g.71616  ORF Transcript_27355/g.71616 Transcript_27355/m.71616 type:complete len:264 (-) Transcript_27355:214-1005(-)